VELAGALERTLQLLSTTDLPQLQQLRELETWTASFTIVRWYLNGDSYRLRQAKAVVRPKS
jgi:hypothetical protein